MIAIYMKQHLATLRAKVRGLRFERAPDAFKDIEGLKARMRLAKCEIPPAIAR